MKEHMKVLTSRKVWSLGYAMVLSTVGVLGTTTFVQDAHAQAAPAQARAGRGTIAVLELRAPDGEDEVASSGTEILRAQARDAGFEVANVAQSLEQMVAAFGCDDAVPLECLQQIASHTHQNRFLFGSVRRGGPRRQTAPVRMEVRLFDNGVVSEPQTAETSRAQAMDTDRWRPQIQAMVTTLLPAPVATTNNNNSNNNNNNNNGNIIAPPPPARPIRRYIGFGAIGVGGVLGVVGLVSGIQWLSLTGAINADAMAAQTGGMRSNDPGVRGLNNLVSPGDNSNAVGLCSALTSQNPGQIMAQYEPGMIATSRENATKLCQDSSGLVLREGVFLGIGAALIGVGLALVITDNTGAAPSQTSPSAAQAEDVTRMRMRAAAMRPPVQWTLSPTFAPQQQGATFLMAF